jgi:glyoxylase-like metal-dependent hydrolase (beta-lactamase superfamily II)
MFTSPFNLNFKASTASLVLILSATLGMTGCTDFKGFMMKQAFPDDYFETFAEQPDEFIQHSERVYSFKVGMDRSMILRTQDGLAIFDIFNKGLATKLKQELDTRFPNEPVRWLVYSHNHLDHIRGGVALNASTVIGHEDINTLLLDWQHPFNDVVPVTQAISEDTVLNLGGIEVRMMFMPMSHSTTLYGFYIPEEDTVFAPDMMFVEAMPPFGFPDWYTPGYLRALDRLINLDAKTYIPSHFNLGTKQDLVDYRNMMADFKHVVERELAKYEYQPEGSESIEAVFDVAYPELKAKYGDWHGFDAMFVPQFVGQVGKTFLGY